MKTVYAPGCVSCIKSMHIGGRKPRCFIDLLFGEETEIGTFEPDAWHDELRKLIDATKDSTCYFGGVI